MFMMLKWAAMILYLETWVTWSSSSTYIFVKVDLCFAFKPHGFLECKTSNYRVGWVAFNPPLAINTNIFLQFHATLRYQRWIITRTTRWLLHAYIPNNIRLNNKNCYLWTREIHTVRRMKIIVCTRRIINESFGRPKNLLPLKVRSVIRKGRCRCAIYHNNY